MYMTTLCVHMTTLCMYSIYLSTSDLLNFTNFTRIISNTVKHKFSSTWKWIRCCNNAMNYVYFVIKRDIYRQKMHSCSKNIRGISVVVLKISVVYKEIYISWVVLHGQARS